MLRSLYSAVSGVKAHQTYLDVTGNNIANVNTVGFKRDVIQFRDMVYQTLKGASAPNNSVPIGGINPAQVGLGVKIGSIETIHTQGSMQSTGNPTDMAISGQGYFVVKNGGQQLYTRAGNFALDRDGNLVMSGNGYLVQGYGYKQQVDPATGNTVMVRDSNLSNINIPIGQKLPAKETTIAAFRCNLCSTTKPAIASLDNIPGGANKVLRPHMYDAYGSISATYVGGTAPTTGTELAGDTWYDTSSNELKKWNTSTTTWDVVREGDPFETFYGKNTDATGYAKIYATTDSTYSGIVAKRAKVDGTGNVAPTNGATPAACTPPITKAGQTYLDIATGQIYTTNSTGTAWNLTTPKTADAGTVYADFTSGVLYEPDPANPGQFIAATSATVLDATTNQLMTWTWDATTLKGSWASVNDKLGLSPTGALDGNGNPITVTSQDTIDAFATSIIKSHDHSTKMDVYDSLGNAYTLEVVFRKVLERPANPTGTPPTSAEAEWDWYAYYVDADGKPLEQYGEGAGTLVFGDDGLLKRTYYYEPTPAVPDPNATSTTQPVYNWSVVEKIIDTNDPRYDSTVHDGLPTGKVVADFNVSGAAGSVTGTAPNQTYSSNMITLDFVGNAISKVLGVEKGAIDGVTQYGSPTTTKGYYQDGYTMGELNDFTVGSDGVITGVYSNGQLLPISQLALAMFANPQGLTKVGDTCFMASSNSGIAQVGPPGTGGAGTIEGSTIEMSNVDLSEEFVNLIKAQRGFQANTRVVTTSDQVLEELINMKR